MQVAYDSPRETITHTSTLKILWQAFHKAFSGGFNTMARTITQVHFEGEDRKFSSQKGTVSDFQRNCLYMDTDLPSPFVLLLPIPDYHTTSPRLTTPDEHPDHPPASRSRAYLQGSPSETGSSHVTSQDAYTLTLHSPGVQDCFSGGLLTARQYCIQQNLKPAHSPIIDHP